MTGTALPNGWDAAYVFRVRVRLTPTAQGVWADPDSVETTIFRGADPPGEPGWLYFRDNCWHGELSDPDHMRTVAEEALEARVDDVSFRELRTTGGYLDDLEEGIRSELDQFNADSADAVLSKYLGSSIHVTDRE